MPEPSNLLLYGFLALIPLTIAAALVGVSRSARDHPGSWSTKKVALMLAVWMAITAALALTGLTGRWDLRPPPAMALIFGAFIITILLARGRFGEQVALGVPLASLIAFQSFRFPLELLLHRAYTDGLMPVQMSFEGQNFDIISGLGGIVIGGFFLATKKDVPRGLAWAFNLVGLVLLLNIVGVAITSTPPFALFGPDHLNVWIEVFPFIWLPAVFVMFALFGHIALTRRLLADAKG